MDHAAALLEQNAQFADLVRAADPTTPVPTCPGWTLRKLATHVGRGDRWAATIARDRMTGPLDQRAVADGTPPDGDPSGWLAAGAQQILDGVAAAGPDTPVWTFNGPRPSAWWIRRRLHEVLVHRGDAALALGLPFEPEPALAADGVSEFLMLMAERRDGGDPPLAEGTSLHLHATDDGLGPAGEWMVLPAAGGIAWEHGHGKGTAAVRGTAADLLLAVTGRLAADDARLQVLGDAGVWTTFRARTSF